MGIADDVEDGRGKPRWVSIVGFEDWAEERIEFLTAGETDANFSRTDKGTWRESYEDQLGSYLCDRVWLTMRLSK